MTAEAHFRATAPRYMRLLMADFGFSDLDAAAVFGNLAHESLGFTKLQEMNPTVKGSRGGYGWAQWTGPRRRAYETWCKKHGKDPAADATNYAYLFVELKGDEKTAVSKTKAARSLDAKTEAFEKAFLRAGVKHYPSRKKWAAIALDAYNGSEIARQNAPVPPPRPIEDYEEPISPPRRPLRDFLTRAAINAALNRLKGLPMNALLLTGMKTYIVALILILVAGLNAVGIVVPGFDMDPGAAIAMALGLIFARNGAKTEIKKLED